MLEEWLALQARNPTLALSGWLEGLVVKGAAYGLDGQVSLRQASLGGLLHMWCGTVGLAAGLR